MKFLQYSVIILSLFLIISCDDFNLVIGAEGYPSTPNFSGVENGQIYAEDFDLIIECDDNSTLHYTLDGSEPTTESKIYNTPIHFILEEGEKQTYTVKARAYNASVIESETVSINFTLDKTRIYLTGYTVPGANADYHTIKCNSLGDVIWARTNDISNGQDIARDIAVDQEGNAYVTGEAYTGADMDYYTIKYNAQGNVMWEQANGGGNDDHAYGIELGADNNLYITGDYRISGTTIDTYNVKLDNNGTELLSYFWEFGDYNLAKDIVIDSNGNTYVTGDYDDYGASMVTKFDVLGNDIWDNRYDTTDDAGYGIGIDRSGFVYVAGVSASVVDDDGLLIKYAADGSQIWVKTYDRGNHEQFQALVVDKAGNICVTGYATNTDLDCYTAKYDPNGNEIWSRIYSTPGDETGNRLTLDKEGNIYVCGYVDNAGNQDFLIIKYNTSGNLVWVRHYDISSEDWAYGIAVLSK